MASERALRVREIVDAASRVEPARRESFVAEACGGDAELLRQVAFLMASSEAETAATEDGDEVAAPAVPWVGPVLGRRIGPYRVVREIGRGGMGAVYLGVRDDEHYRVQVAIKLMHGAGSAGLERRFRSERQILAHLDHPNIARLFDGGTLEEGVPYLVMEHVEGEPIGEYCDRRRLSTLERLQLFRTLCGAVHYAHQNLVVHRDIKPSNVLVTPGGVPKLLDFGIAKLVKPEATSETADLTLVAVRLMTPEYASPEQVRGAPVTTASDVYSLGVLLYELLTGHRPHRLQGRALQDIERAVCLEHPDKPSTAVGRTVDAPGLAGATPVRLTPQTVSAARGTQPEKLQRRLEGDLDNIVLMAMRKEPARRYASAEQLSEDVRRYTEGLPVIARRDTWGYRAGKFVGRHRLGVALAATATALLLVFGVSMAHLASRLGRERDKAERVTQFMVDLFEVPDPSEARGSTVTAREILDRGATHIETGLGDQPEVQATLMDTVGRAYRGLGLYEQAAALLGEALATRERVLGEDDLETAETMAALADALRKKADYAAAEPLVRRALEFRRRVLGPEHPLVATSLDSLAVLLRDEGDLDAAEPLFRRALAIRRRLLVEGHPDVATTLLGLAEVLERRGDATAAEPLAREALAIRRKALPAGDWRTAEAAGTLAGLLAGAGRHAEAEALARESLDLLEAKRGPRSSEAQRALRRLIGIYEATGRSEQAGSLRSRLGSSD
jgi:eukaryotic-like serine/threonine-protein kinase